MKAIDFGSNPHFPVRATLDVVGYWRLRGFLRFSIVHLVLLCVRQHFGHN